MIPRKGFTVTLAAPSPTPIPRAAGSFPLLGHSPHLARDTLAFLASLRDTGEPLIEITLQPGTRTLVVQDPALIQEMLTTLGPSLDKGRFFEKMGHLLGGDSVVTAAGRAHVRKRRQLQPAFAHTEIARYVDIMRTTTADATAAWQPGRELDVRDAMVQLSLDILAKTVFGGSIEDTAFRELRRDLSVVMNGVGARVMLPDWAERLPLPVNRRFNRARDAVRARVSAAVADLQVSGHDSGDMLSMLLRARNADTGRPLSGHEISSEILTLAVAGTETTASVLSWILYELARNPKVEAHVLEELDTVLAGRPIAFEDLPRLEYLDRVVTEALRLHHTGYLVTRRTTTATRLGRWTIPAGTELAYCQHALHRDPRLHPDPLRFDPDRWLDDAQHPPTGAFLPFGAGKHQCIGDRYARTELLTAIATIVPTVRLELTGDQVVKPVARATVRPGTLQMAVRRREAAPHRNTAFPGA